MTTPSGTVDPLIGVMVGEFQIGGLLALGGRGRVYWATHRNLPSLRRAVKVLNDANTEADRTALLREAQAVSQVKGLNVVALHDFGRLPTAGREPYLMMELLEGETLEERLLRVEQLPFRDALDITEQVLAGLLVIHEAGLVHRDIKPSNLFLFSDASHRDVVKVMDLGLAEAKPQGSMEMGIGRTPSSNRCLTPDYASPEQFGELAVGPASDVYSLGVVLYEMVTGRLLFPTLRTEPMALGAERHRTEIPDHPCRCVPDLPEPVADFMLSLLEKNPLARPTVGAAINQVRRLREQFKDRFREGPTQVRARALARPGVETQRLDERVVARGQNAEPHRARRGLLGGALVALATLGLFIGLGGARQKPGAPLAPPAAPPIGLTTEETTAPPAPPDSSGLVVSAGAGEESLAELTPLRPISPPGGPDVRPSNSAARPKASAAASSRRSASLKAATGKCIFDAGFFEWANRRRNQLWRMADTSNPEVIALDRAVDEALTASDCQRSREALSRLSKAIGVSDDE